MNDDSFEMINDIDFSYGFIYECANLVNNLYDHYNYDHLAIKLYCNFVLPIINITKDEHIKEYNEHAKNSKYIKMMVTQRSLPGNLSRGIITQFRGFVRKDFRKVSRSVRTNVYLVLTSQVQARSSIVGRSAYTVDVQCIDKSRLFSWC